MELNNKALASALVAYEEAAHQDATTAGKVLARRAAILSYLAETRPDITEEELLRERAKNGHLMKVLLSVYRLAPSGEDIHLPDGRVMRFKDPNAAETLHYLGRAIQAIPDELAKLESEPPK